MAAGRDGCISVSDDASPRVEAARVRARVVTITVEKGTFLSSIVFLHRSLYTIRFSEAKATLLSLSENLRSAKVFHEALPDTWAWNRVVAEEEISASHRFLCR